jgi:hypothetical protein
VSLTLTEVSRGQNPGLETPPFLAATRQQESAE